MHLLKMHTFRLTSAAPAVLWAQSVSICMLGRVTAILASINLALLTLRHLPSFLCRSLFRLGLWLWRAGLADNLEDHLCDPSFLSSQPLASPLAFPLCLAGRVCSAQGFGLSGGVIVAVCFVFHKGQFHLKNWAWQGMLTLPVLGRRR